MYSLWATTPTILACTLLFSITFILLFIEFSRRPRSSDGALPPSPSRLPLIGNLHHITKNLHYTLHTLSLKFGPIILVHLGSIPYCVISSGNLAREVTITHDALFSDRPTTKASRMLFPKRDDIIFSPDNKLWRLTRKLCVYELLSPKSVHSFQYIRKEQVSNMVADIRSACQRGNRSEINLNNLFLELATNVLCRAVLGLKGLNDVNGRLALQGAYAMSDILSFEDCFPALACLDRLTGLNKRLKTTCEAIHLFLDKIIVERQIQVKGEGGHIHGNDTKCFVDIILEHQEKDMADNIRSILLDMFIGGIATTASTMEWAMAELAKNPGVMKKVQAEVRAVVGQKTEIHEEDITRMEYLKCVVKEVLRLHGPTMTGRQTSTTATISGFKIPPKMTTLINIWTIHRDPATWNSPSEFLPERFIDTNYNFIGQDNKYFPFGLGKRICPGAHFAITEIEYALANVLCWFDWELPEGVEAKDLDMRGSNSVTAHRISPLFLVPKPVLPSIFSSQN